MGVIVSKPIGMAAECSGEHGPKGCALPSSYGSGKRGLDMSESAELVRHLAFQARGHGFDSWLAHGNKKVESPLMSPRGGGRNRSG